MKLKALLNFILQFLHHKYKHLLPDERIHQIAFLIHKHFCLEILSHTPIYIYIFF